MHDVATVTVRLIVNGQPVELEVPAGLTLLDLLRDYLGLTGAKNGCDHQGHCGACTVVMDGKAVRACLVRVARANGKSVETIEGLAAAGQLHPIQQAFIMQGAIQCGFCTPGLIMATKALLDANPQPSESEIRAALKPNLCRCAGYSKISAAVNEAAHLLAGEGPAPQPGHGRNPVGRSVLRKDAVAKATGETRYAADMSLQGMLHGKVLWSPVVHARILGVDTTVAGNMPGVHAILTAKDVPDPNRFGLITADQPILADDRVRFLGDAIAVVFADTPVQATAAVETIQVSYEELPLVLSPEEALAGGAIQLHEGGNLLDHTAVRVGDVQAGFAQADVVVEGTYSTPQVEHAYLEPEAGMAAVTDDGRVTIWSGTHEPAKIQAQVTAALNVLVDQVRVVHVPTGGAFGAKHDVLLQIFLALGAVYTGRPVHMALSRAESLRVHPKRHAFTMHYKTGARRDGTITAMEAKIIGDGGAYASESAPVMWIAMGMACGPYAMTNVALDGYVTYTNNPTAGAMRGFGIPQVTFAVESQMDRLARELDLDPFEIRLRNALDIGKVHGTGYVLRERTVFPDLLRAVREAARDLPPARPGKRRGVGVACGIKNTGLGYGRDPGAGAAVEVTAEGKILVRVGTVELGQGLETMAAQVAAQCLGVDYAQVQVIAGDTGETPYGGPTIASRGTYVAGSAVHQAATALRGQLVSRAAETFTLPVEAILFEDGHFIDVLSEEMLGTLEDLARVARERGWALSERTHYMPPAAHALRTLPCNASCQLAPPQLNTHFGLAFTVQVAVVDVDEATGDVQVVKLIIGHDGGRVIHPQNVEAQLEGGAIMGMGYALSEEFRAYGPQRTDTLRKCKIPDITQAPEVEILLVESDSMVGPSGGKAVGEVGVGPAPPAIINAIYDAVGVRITSLPATREKVLAALSGKCTTNSLLWPVCDRATLSP